MIKESVDGCKHCSNDEELQRKERTQVYQEDEDADLSNAAMLRSSAANHLDEVSEDLISTKHGAVHPASPLLHQNHHRLGCVCEGLGVGNICQIEGVHFLDIDL